MRILISFILLMFMVCSLYATTILTVKLNDIKKQTVYDWINNVQPKINGETDKQNAERYLSNCINNSIFPYRKNRAKNNYFIAVSTTVKEEIIEFETFTE